MKKIIILIFIINALFAYAQNTNIAGTYMYSNPGWIQSDIEYMQISNNLFKIISYQYSDVDTLVAIGHIKILNNNFIRLKSDIDSIMYKVYIEEHFNPQLKDNIEIKFIFPFKGKYRIELMPSSSISTESDSILVPKNVYKLNYVPYFKIYNCNIVTDNYGIALGRTVFLYLCDFQIKHKDTNFLIIRIPNLTNSFFNRYLIEGEYAKVEKNKIIWRNRIYRKISNKLVVPKREYHCISVDDRNGVDPAELKQKFNAKNE